MAGDAGNPDTALRAARPRASLEEDAALAELRGRLFGRRCSPRLARYELRSLLGVGGMAVVFAAFDPELRRDVAIKLRPIDRPHGEREAARLLREGQVLAGLHHPNLVEVYDVGRYVAADLPAALADVAADGVFIVIALVRGTDLAQWLGDAKRSRAEVLRHFVAAGRGLAYAHDRGVIHRDFKPANVMLGEDGIAKVVDFGLASTAHGDAEDPQPGARQGTPAYMAPEQHDGGAIDARADQFAFAASLAEALLGERMFVGADLPALLAAKQRAPLGAAALPRRLRNALARALQTDPRARFASMHELLHAIDRRGSPLPWLVGIGTAAAAALALALPSLPHDDGCALEGQQAIESVWGTARRTALHDAFAAGGSVRAASQVGARLDAWADGWQRARVEACRAAGGGDGHAAARAACLDARLAEVDALVAVLTEADADVIRRAADAVAESTSLGCEVSRRGHAAPDGPRAAIQRLLDRAEALKHVARYDAALAEVDRALAEPTMLDDPALHADALVRRGALLERKGEVAASAAVLRDAFFAADLAGASRVAARAAALLVAASGREGSRQDVESWTRHARVQLEREGGDAEIEELLAGNLGIAWMLLGEDETAAMHLREAVALRSVAVPGGDARTAALLDNLGGVLQELGRGEEASALHHRALELTKRELGGDHPQVATVLTHIARLDFEAGRLDEALANSRSALAIASATDPPSVHVVVAAGAAVGLSLLELGRADEAHAAFETALATLAVRVPPHDPQVLQLRTMRAMASARAGRAGRAREEAQSVLDTMAAAGEHDQAAMVELRALVRDE